MKQHIYNISSEELLKPTLHKLHIKTQHANIHDLQTHFIQYNMVTFAMKNNNGHLLCACTEAGSCQMRQETGK